MNSRQCDPLQPELSRISGSSSPSVLRGDLSDCVIIDISDTFVLPLPRHLRTQKARHVAAPSLIAMVLGWIAKAIAAGWAGTRDLQHTSTLEMLTCFLLPHA